MRVLVAVLLVGIVPVQLAAAPKVSSDDSTGVSNAASAVAALKKLGARIKQDDQGNVVELNLSRSKITDSWLMHLKELTNLKSLVIGGIGSQITDAGLVNLKGMTKVEELLLFCPKVTDAGLVHLTGLTNLQELSLGSTKVTDAGVADLKKALPNCKISK